MPLLPRKKSLSVTKCHACTAKKRSLQTSATPATPNDIGCQQVPRLPRRMHVDVAKCHTCHKVKAGVAKCHACHAKCRSMSPSAAPATQTAAATMAPNGNQACRQSEPSAISATPATRSEGQCRQVPRLPHKVQADVTPATQTAAATPAPNQNQARHQSHSSARSATPATRSEGQCRQVPRLPHKVQADVTPATQTAAATTAPNENQARHQSQPSAISATPATQNARRCRQVRVFKRLVFKLKRSVSKPVAWVAGGVGGNKLTLRKKVCFWRKTNVLRGS